MLSAVIILQLSPTQFACVWVLRRSGKARSFRYRGLLGIIKNNETMTTELTEIKDGQLTMMRFGKDLADMDRSFDIEFWQRQGDKAIFDAAWELVEFYLRDRGATPDEYRLQRTIENFQRTRS